MTAAVATLCVLVVDDEAGIRNLIVHWLERQGHCVFPAENARDARRLLHHYHFDLVITDVVMPDGDGFELIGALRKEHPTTRIVAISGGGQYIQGEECISLAVGLGAHASVMKPFRWEELQVGIERALPFPDALNL